MYLYVLGAKSPAQFQGFASNLPETLQLPHTINATCELLHHFKLKTLLVGTSCSKQDFMVKLSCGNWRRCNEIAVGSLPGYLRVSLLDDGHVELNENQVATKMTKTIKSINCKTYKLANTDPVSGLPCVFE